jgi:hypothetical protein
MAWTVPKTWVTAEMVTAAMLNTYVRDNLTAIRDQVSSKMRRSSAAANQSIPNTTETRVSFDTVDWDTVGTIADTTNNRLNFPISGKYVIGCGLRWTSNANGHREIKMWYHDSVANTNVCIDHDASEAVSSLLPVLSTDTVFDCKAGDYVYLTGWQNSGGALTILQQDVVDPAIYCAKEGI